MFSFLFTVSFYIVAELASLKLMRQVALDEDKKDIHKPPKFYKPEKRFQNETYISNFKLKTMRDSIINHKGGFQLDFVSISRVINHITC